MNDDYYMKKTKKICPMCIFYIGELPPESIKLCITHAEEMRKKPLYWSLKEK